LYNSTFVVVYSNNCQLRGQIFGARVIDHAFRFEATTNMCV